MIVVLRESPIVLTESQRDALFSQYQTETRFWYSTQPPPSFEAWLRQKGY